MTASPHALVMASAGTGKTYQLTGRYIDLTLRAVQHEREGRPADLARILAATFTRKAAGEILDRILDRLSAACETPAKLEELSRQLGRPITPADCRQLLARIVRDLHRLNVLTIDALFLRIAAAFSLELGITPGWMIADEEQDAALRAEALDLALHNMDDRETLVLLEMLHGEGGKRSVRESILSAVNTIYSAFLLSGARREVWEHFGPSRPCLDSDALAAAVRALEACPLPTTAAGKPSAVWQKALDKALQCARAQDWPGLLRAGIPAKIVAGEREFSRSPITADILAVHQPLIDHAIASLMREFRNQNIAAFELAARFDRAYEAIKAERGLYRFDDIPRLLIRADLAGRLEHLYFRLDSAISHILLDEFQDTSLTQFRLLAPLLDEIMAAGDGRSVFVVGDVKQSLYVWRDAEPGLMSAMPRRWSVLERLGLQQSFRSSPVITGTVNKVFERLAENPALAEHPAAAQDWCGRFATHSSARQLKGAARLWVAPEAQDDDQGPSQHVLTMQMAAARVSEILSAAPGATVGVLVRTNKHIPRIIYELRRLDIFASEEGGSPLLDSPPVAVAVSLLHLADFPGDTAAAYHIATSPLGPLLGLSYPPHAAQLARISARVRERIMTDGYAHTLEWIHRHCAAHMDQRGFDRFEQLIIMAQEFDARGGGTRPGGFVDVVRARRVEDPRRQNVRVMSIHKSKGLEFDAVVLPDLESPWRLKPDTVLVDRPGPFDEVLAATRYPSDIFRRFDPGLQSLFQRSTDRLICEELCCLYVGLTRAIHSLDMIVEPRASRTQPSAARLLTQALAPGASPTPGAELWRSNPFEDWQQSIARKDPAPTEQPLSIRIAPGATSPVPRLRRITPSSLESAPAISAGSLFSTRGETSRESGTLLHSWFERILWADEAIPPRDELIASAMRSGLAEAEAAALANSFLEMLAGPAAAALSRGRYAGRPAAERIEVLRERTFEVRLTGDDGRPLAVRGQMDRLVLGLTSGKPVWAEVIDYKSDAVSPGTPEFELRTAHYAPQLQAYARAVRAMYGLPSSAISVSLLFIRSGAIVEIPPP